MINALVIDLEHWHSIELLRNHNIENPVDQVPESVRPILNLLDKYEIKATFAVLGTVAEKHPELIKEIYDNGHEIASHAWSHRTLHALGKNSFEKEIEKSVKVLESITGERPIGFRAPSFSMDNSTIWALDVLEAHQFKYDASVYPIRTMLYGVSNAPIYIYKPSKKDIIAEDPNGEIIEFPMTVLRIGRNIPLAGGFYFRILPLWFLKYGIQKINKKRPAIIYIHPWELYPKTPRQNLPFFSRFITYYGINNALEKFDSLLHDFKFSSIRNVLEL